MREEGCSDEFLRRNRHKREVFENLLFQTEVIHEEVLDAVGDLGQEIFSGLSGYLFGWTLPKRYRSKNNHDYVCQHKEKIIYKQEKH